MPFIPCVPFMPLTLVALLLLGCLSLMVAVEMVEEEADDCIGGDAASVDCGEAFDEASLPSRGRFNMANLAICLRTSGLLEST